MRAAGLLCVLTLPLAAACGPTGDGPDFEEPGDQLVGVGEGLELELRASSAAGGAIRYSYQTDAPDLGDRASLTVRPDGVGLFTWQPDARDVGTWTFDFTAHSGVGKTTIPVVIEVRSTVGEDSLPVFRRPLGQGRTLDPSQEDCVEIELLVSDEDSTEVSFTQEEPRIEGGNIAPQGGHEAFWRWCPTETQKQAQDRYLLTISADDGENPKVLKRYLIVLRESSKPSCPGQPPAIDHVARDVTSVNGIEVVADISEESGLKGTPFLYYSTEPLGDPPDLSRMVQLSMELRDGSDRDGTWVAEIPNPIADAAERAATLSYAIVAEDNDDRGGECDHVTAESYQITVSGSGEAGGLGICEPCSGDVQCGGAGDLCVRMGVEGEAFCAPGCAGDGDCADGFTCSTKSLSSVSGASGRQCVPLEGTCAAAAGPTCSDDDFEQNDSRAAAQPLSPGATEELRICPVDNLGVDEDWFTVEVERESEIEIAIDGATYPNMELKLLDDAGAVIAASEDWGSTDQVSRCLAPGTYHARVYSYFSGENDYTVSYTSTPATCPPADQCTDDAFEDDDGIAEARIPDFESFVYRSSGNFICSGDDDWFYIYLFGGETISGTLRFDQTSPEEDLDLLVYDGGGALLTPCTEENPIGCTDNGQSGTSNEDFSFTAETAGDHYLVVHGFAGSENDYDICLSLEPGLCP